MHRNQYQQKRSHHDYRPHERVDGEPDGKETAQLLPQVSRDRLMKLFEDGTLRDGELDHKSVLTLQALSEPLQVRAKYFLHFYRFCIVESDRAFRSRTTVSDELSIESRISC